MRTSPRCARASRAIAQLVDAGAFGAVIAAEDPAIGLDTVTEDPDPALCADRGEQVDGAFEAVEFAVTYAIARHGARYAQESDPAIALMSFLMALAFPTLWLLLRAVFGPIPPRPRQPMARGE